MQLLLTKEDTWEIIIGNPPDLITEAWRKKDFLTYVSIRLNMEDE